MKKRSLQNSASSRRSSATIIDVSPDSISPSSQQMDERPIKTPSQELSQSQGIDENTDVPDAADYQAPFGEEAGKISECSLLDDMKKQMDHLSSERMQEREKQREETKRELDELRKEIWDAMRNELHDMRDERRQELQEMRDERRQELRNEIHKIREDIKHLIDAVRKMADDTKESVQEN